MNQKSGKIIGLSLACVIIFVFSLTIVKADDYEITYIDDDAEPDWYNASNFSTIQEGVDNTITGGTVYVYDGTYEENVLINKSINLIGNKSETTIIKAANSSKDVIIISENNVTVTGFHLENATIYPKAGFFLETGVQNCTIVNNIITNNSGGFFLNHSCGNNQIINNTMNGNEYGFFASSSCINNSIIGNAINNSYDGNGIHIDICNNNSIINNTVSNSSKNGIFFSNNCYNNTIQENKIFMNTIRGIYIRNSKYNYIQKNHIHNNYRGLYFSSSNNNHIILNNISINIEGIFLSNSINNIIYDNYLNNDNNAWDNADNYWNISKKLGQNIINGLYQGGNYWSDHISNDTNGDGIGDNIYNISGGNNSDYLPLIYSTNIFPVANFSYSPLYPTDLENITFVDTSYDDDFITNWRWDFGDGNFSYQQNPVYRYIDNGSYIVNLTVTDNLGANESIEKIINVQNVIPIVNFSYSKINSNNSSNPIEFNSNSSYDPDGNIISWLWDFGDGNSSTESNPIHNYSLKNTYMVSLTVMDNDGAINSYSRNITIINEMPIVNFSFSPSSPFINDEITFTDNSFDSDGVIINWTWDFGDGSISTIQNPSHTYTKKGTFTVMLTINDNDGGFGNTSKAITIQKKSSSSNSDNSGSSYIPPMEPNSKPVAIIDTVIYGFVDTEIHFDGSSSYDLDGIIINWTWDFGDGNHSYGQNSSHLFVSHGNYTISLKVTDDKGDSNTSHSYLILSKRQNILPIVYLLNYSKFCDVNNSNCQFSLNCIDSNNNEIRYFINWGDNSNFISDFIGNNTIYNISHKWQISGRFIVEIYAIDENNGTSNLIEIPVMVNSLYCKNIGYIIDNNNDGIYDLFISNETKNSTVMRYVDGKYQIDIDDDGKNDYVYDITSKTLAPFKNNSAEIQNSLLFLLIGLTLSLFILIAFILRFRRENLLKIIKNLNLKKK